MSDRNRLARLAILERRISVPRVPQREPLPTAEERERQAHEAVSRLLLADARGEPSHEGGRMALVIVDRYVPGLRQAMREQRGRRGAEDAGPGAPEDAP